MGYKVKGIGDIQDCVSRQIQRCVVIKRHIRPFCFKKSKIFFRPIFLCISALFLYINFTSQTYAQEGFEEHAQGKIIADINKFNLSTGLKSLDFGLMGENIDPATGGISFYHRYVELPGNSGLPVHYGRSLQNVRGWVDDVPTIRAKVLITQAQYDEPRDGEYWGRDRCSRSGIPYVLRFDALHYCYANNNESKGSLFSKNYFDGRHLETSDGRSRPLMSVSKAHPEYAAYSREFDWTSPTLPEAEAKTIDNMRLSCIPDIGDGRGQGFLATDTQGTTYRFDKLFYHRTKTNSYDLTAEYENTILLGTWDVGDALMRVSEVKDVHGNWVRYEYTVFGDVSRIYSNDGREITVEYDKPEPVDTRTHDDSGWPNPAIFGGQEVQGLAVPDRRIKANGREWRITYEPYTQANGEQAYHYRVILPDGTYWEMGGNDYRFPDQNPDSSCMVTEDGYAPSLSMRHPSGSEATFTMGPVVTLYQTDQEVRPYGGKFNACDYYGGDPYEIPWLYRTILSFWGTARLGVATKTLTIPGSTTGPLTWHYEYEPQPSIPATLPNKLTWRSITNPDGTVVKYWVNRTKDWALYGKIEKTERFEANSTAPIETIENSYEPGHKVAFKDFILKTKRHIYVTYATQRKVTRGNDIYTTDYVYNRDTSSPDYSYERPIRIEKHSNLASGTRTTDVVYEHLKDKWILSVPKHVTRNGVPFADMGYSNNGLLEWHDVLGTRVRTNTYHPDGTLHTVSDGLNRTTTYSNYKRGVPQLATRPDGKSIEKTVDDNGWIKSFKNISGYEERYTHNDMGWLIYIERLADSSWFNGTIDWSDTAIAYSGLGNGITQTETRGAKQTITTYDGLQRPTDVRVTALSGGGDDIYTRTEYDNMGRTSFTSFPSAFSNPADGIETTYDALGRVLTVAENVPPYATTTNTYLGGNRLQIQDPMGNLTTTTKSGYGGPDDGSVTLIESPLDANTAMTYDIYGNMLSVRQYGTQNGYTVDQTQLYSYDNRYRLCRHYTPETGSKLFEYDIENQLTAYAEGQSGTSGCASIPSSARVALSYDNLGRNTLVNYPDATPDISTAYFSDQYVLINKGGSAWSYNYNRQGMLEDEELFSGDIFHTIRHKYNADGNLIHEFQYSGLDSGWEDWIGRLDYALNGLGQTTKVQETGGGTTYASGITYHPNGAIKHLNFGNGRSFDRALNASQLPSQLSYANGFTWDYNYDANKRITSINDSADNNYDRTLGYDGLNRLTSANSPAWGNANYTYDALGNLRLRQLGSRTVNIGYDGQNRLSSANDSANGNWGYNYDTKGNVINDGRRVLTYDAANQPTAITGPATASFAYDGNQKRVKQTIDGKTIYSIYSQSGAMKFRHNVTDNKKTDYIAVSGMSIAKVSNGTTTYQYTDHLGSTIMEADASGNVIAASKEQYAPFGEKLNNASTNQDDVSYTGHIEDSAIGLTYMQARYYDPVVGRFLSNDPVGFLGHINKGNLQGFNRYAYANNDPYKYIDPDGKESLISILFGKAKDKAKDEIKGKAKGLIVDEMRNSGMSEDQICRAMECNPKTMKPGQTPSTCAYEKCQGEHMGEKLYPAGSEHEKREAEKSASESSKKSEQIEKSEGENKEEKKEKREKEER